jgi:hypothetical protein
MDNFSQVVAGTVSNTGKIQAAKNQMRIGITTYLNVALSGIVNSAELFPSESSKVTMSWPILAKASIR